MNENTTLNESDNLCKDCVFRFRRIFIPRNPEHFNDEDGLEFLEGEENIVIMNMCVVSDMDLELDSTIDCTHYECRDEIEECDKVSIFKHLK